MSEAEDTNKRGVFWIVDDELLAVPYDEDAAEGLSKNGFNYNHRLLWSHVKPKGCDRRFDYYPRGRVEYTSYGKPIIYMGLSVEPRFVPEIIEAFDIREEPVVRRDGSNHYLSEKERMDKQKKKRRRLNSYRRNGLL